MPGVETRSAGHNKERPDLFSMRHFQADVLSTHLLVWKGRHLQTGCFPSWCLSQILRIPPSFVSRVTNEHVLRQANCAKLSRVLQQRQLQLLGRIAQLPSEDVMRKCVFRDGSFQLTLSASARRRCRGFYTKFD